ncbi:insulinase family protein [Flavobacteriaceae bacterium R38]|nr:insulinase family protein [Flavobacteriaceae bacterium R38]
MKNTFTKFTIALFLSAFIFSCQQESKETEEHDEGLSVSFEKFTLDNGLDVIFHKDASDPITSVALTFHVGSAREKAGRTGFAHLFEHLLFLESENLGKGGLDILNSKVGGSGANGSTSRDRTNYFQTVPNDALEKMIWAEADKLGFFINTVTEEVLAKEKQVVKNEKRQSVDNNPYGHTNYVIGKSLYPENHPYNWQVIGSLEDLQNATLEDVKEFYRKWYVPNNATLVIAGDFDSAQAKEWVEKYFAEIKRGDEITPLPKNTPTLASTKKLYYEDNFARLPQLRLTWPTVENYHPDSYALDVLAQYLTDGKKAPFQKVLVEEKELAPNMFMFNSTSELTGEFNFITRAYPGKNLNDVQAAVNEAFIKFENEGIAQEDLDRIKIGLETDFYNGLSSVLGKAFQLAQYNIFANDPGFINQDIKNILAVTTDDVKRVYEKYIKGKHHIITSFVPKGQSELIITDSQLAEVVEEKIVQGAEEEINLPESSEYERTASSFDRTVEPPYGTPAKVKVPDVWKGTLDNGMKVLGIVNDELPLVQFNIKIKGGLLLDNPEKVGTANLLADLMNKGTKNKTTEELEEAINSLGATINVNAGNQSIEIFGNTLARNYDATIALLKEILLEPRWDEKELTLLKQQTISGIINNKANPNAVAGSQFNKLIYGKDHILSNSLSGTEGSVENITMEDLKAYYNNNISPSISNFYIVGDIDQEKVLASLKDLGASWENKEVTIPEYKLPEPVNSSKVYFYDIPNAKQSVLRIGYLALPVTDNDYYPATVMNYILGGGGFASRLTQQLREGKGYTYGIGSGFGGTEIPGTFGIFSGVRSNITLEAVALIKDILEEYPETFSDKDLETTKGFLLKSNARAFETLGAKLNILENIGDYNWPNDYVKQREEIVNNMTIEEIKRLANQYVNPGKMIYLVVGDAATQMDRLKDLGFGAPVLLNKPIELN